MKSSFNDNELYWQHIIVILGSCFFLTDWLSFGEMVVRLKLDVQGLGGGKILNVDGQKGGVGLKNSTNFQGRYMCIIPGMSSYSVVLTKKIEIYYVSAADVFLGNL